jgi:SNF2 family DNA or RNA helicase
LERVEPALREAGLRTLRLDGTTPAADRRRLVDQFQNAEADVFLISLKAGGSGLNLTNADTVFHLDPWWNPAAEAQATDRAHRIGQTRPVTVYKLVAEGTVEEGVLAMQAEKQAMVASVLDDDGGAAGPIDVDDLTALLEFTA